jgi:hypothetical protein
MGAPPEPAGPTGGIAGAAGEEFVAHRLGGGGGVGDRRPGGGRAGRAEGTGDGFLPRQPRLVAAGEARFRPG